MSFNVPDFIKFMVFILVVLVGSPPCLCDGEKEYMLQVVLCAPIEYMGDTFHQHVCHFTCNDKLWRILVRPAAGSLPLFSQRWNVPHPNNVHLLQDRCRLQDLSILHGEVFILCSLQKDSWLTLAAVVFNSITVFYIISGDLSWSLVKSSCLQFAMSFSCTFLLCLNVPRSSFVYPSLLYIIAVHDTSYCKCSLCSFIDNARSLLRRTVSHLYAHNTWFNHTVLRALA